MQHLEGHNHAKRQLNGNSFFGIICILSAFCYVMLIFFSLRGSVNPFPVFWPQDAAQQVLGSRSEQHNFFYLLIDEVLTL
jgi:hypothetical protein